jgi:tetratricopeptide (TPR) repeat protein
MRKRCTRLLVWLWMATVPLATAALADQNDPRLDDLFDELRTVTSPNVARSVESEIWSIWLEVDHRETRRALVRGVRAMQLGWLAQAETAFNRAIHLSPDFAEAWNKRATVRFLAGRLSASVTDIQATLALEPRHFGALSGLGMIYDRLDEPEAALRSYEAALAINPHMEATRNRVEALRERLAGAPI